MDTFLEKFIRANFVPGGKTANKMAAGPNKITWVSIQVPWGLY